MKVSEAIDSRMSCRAFLSTPVPGHIVRSILEKAKRAPSGGNLQPWHVYVLAGTPLQEFLADIRAKISANPRGEGTEYDVYPPKLTEPYRTRRFKCGEDLYATINIARENSVGRFEAVCAQLRVIWCPCRLVLCH